MDLTIEQYTVEVTLKILKSVSNSDGDDLMAMIMITTIVQRSYFCSIT